MVHSLTKLALKSVATNVGELDERHLRSLPVSLLHELWTMVQQGSHCSLREIKQWGYFFKLLVDEHDYKTSEWPTLGMWRMQANFRATDSVALLKTIEPAISLNFDFITHLRLRDGVSCEVRDIVCLTDMVNLGILEIMQPPNSPDFPRVSDGVIREWAAVENPFPVLRVLRIHGEHFTTFKSLQYLQTFRCLAVYDVAGLKSDWPRNIKALTPFLWINQRYSWSDNTLTFLTKTQMIFGCSSKARDTDGERENITLAQIKSIIEPHNFLVQKQTYEEIEAQAVPQISVDDSIRWCSDSHAITPWSLWSYMVFCQAGEARRDEDYRAQGVKTASKARHHVGHLVLPARPIALLNSTSEAGPLYARPDRECPFERHCTFFRPDHSKGQEKEYGEPQTSASAPSATLESRKRKGSGKDSKPLMRKRKPEISLSEFFQAA